MEGGDLETLKTKPLSQIKRPFLMDGSVTVMFKKRWKKRYLVWKNSYIIFFDKNSQNEKPKDVIELKGTTTMNVEYDAKEKKNVVKFKSDPDEFWVLADETVPFLEMGFQAFKNGLEVKEKERIKIEEEEKIKIEAIKQKEEEVSKVEEVKKKMNDFLSTCKKMDKYQLEKLLKLLGKNNSEYYFYTIMEEATKQWDDADFIKFGYQQMCDEDLDDFASFIGGKEIFDDQIHLLLGTDDEGIIHAADLILRIAKEFKVEWSELVKGVFVAFTCWGFNSSDKRLRVFLSILTAPFTPDEVFAFLSFYKDYEVDCGLSDWGELSEDIQSIFLVVSKNWTKEETEHFCEMAQKCWGWQNDVICRMKTLLLDKNFN
ncbi:hypothetical protein EIN_497530 [Entamoeba invadens IP1]|uniref:PH domain-containing protein n=1 Tax=Entamoeba invadens IP1 TaxID=370355 RepID=A0A0A1UH34_ENTIV|nr:hypothetical protein EIN_497530 [Entamoeba invadens IP1]ELP94593.1 hypothetical protein EIN_497530 [Entamoeba invadens IP1]|eukprot:XP_004261364.1 hypothetical protein EIN_497530 [Entamoeba invadens IP1]